MADGRVVDAIEGMAGRGKLTVRTARDCDRVPSRSATTGPASPRRCRPCSGAFYTSKPVGKGTGLGLDICWRIVVQRHGGDLGFTSTPGDTRFQVLLPFIQNG
jgi:C4-dicarboxylate-specific signal transduction histidine kinase